MDKSEEFSKNEEPEESDSKFISEPSKISVPISLFGIDQQAKLIQKGNNSDVYEIAVKDHEFIIKDVRDESETLDGFPGNSLLEKVKNMKLFFDVLKKHLGETAWNTSFMIAENITGNPTARIVQRKVDGWRLDSIKNKLPEITLDKIDKEIVRLKYKLESSFADEELKQADFGKVIDWVRKDAFFDKNIFITKGKENRIVLIDLV